RVHQSDGAQRELPLSRGEPAVHPRIAHTKHALVESRDCFSRTCSGCVVNASTATIYRHALDRAMDEATGELGGDEPGAPDTWNFSIGVAKAWEQAFFSTATPLTRKIAIRSAITFSPDRGGVFDVLSGLVRRGLGGR